MKFSPAALLSKQYMYFTWHWFNIQLTELFHVGLDDAVYSWWTPSTLFDTDDGGANNRGYIYFLYIRNRRSALSENNDQDQHNYSLIPKLEFVARLKLLVSLWSHIQYKEDRQRYWFNGGKGTLRNSWVIVQYVVIPCHGILKNLRPLKWTSARKNLLFDHLSGPPT